MKVQYIMKMLTGQGERGLNQREMMQLRSKAEEQQQMMDSTICGADLDVSTETTDNESLCQEKFGHEVKKNKP